MKDKIIGCRVTEEDYKEMTEARKVLQFKTMSELVVYLWDKYKRGITKVKK